VANIFSIQNTFKGIEKDVKYGKSKERQKQKAKHIKQYRVELTPSAIYL
jgi:hypothetical protein